MRRQRVLLCALAALAVPLPAFALAGGGDPAPAGLDVQASFDECGLLESQIVCKIDATWSSAENATSYQASVTRPDSSVVDQGEVGEGGSTFWVPYAGDGTYTVQISAYGEVDADPQPDLVAKARATASERLGRSHASGSARAKPHAASGDRAAQRSARAHGNGAHRKPGHHRSRCEQAPPPADPATTAAALSLTYPAAADTAAQTQADLQQAQDASGTHCVPPAVEPGATQGGSLGSGSPAPSP